jgi:hypothetical protein
MIDRMIIMDGSPAAIMFRCGHDSIRIATHAFDAAFKKAMRYPPAEYTTDEEWRDERCRDFQ